MSVELESPVVVIPRSARSSQVVVAHLGRMSLANRPGPPKDTTYKVRIRDISLASVRFFMYSVTVCRITDGSAPRSPVNTSFGGLDPL